MSNRTRRKGTHAARASGREFGNAALDYERGRPDWPAEALDAVPVHAGAEVLDLAAGTGKLTRLLATRYERVVAIEPDDAMRALIEGVETHAGTAEAIPLPESSVDAVFVGEAFHWFDGDRVVAEIVRVLRPSGHLVLLWNGGWGFDPLIPDDAMGMLGEIYERAGRPGGPSYHSGEWRTALERSPFEPLREAHFPREISLEPDQAVSLWLSVSSVASLDEAERATVRTKLARAVTDRRLLSLTTDLYWTRLPT